MAKNEDKIAPAAVSTELLTPEEWGFRKDMIGKPDPIRPYEPPPKKAEYAAADALHGWTADAHDYQSEDQKLRISEGDFDKALEAAGMYPAVPAHEPACGRKFKDRAKPVVHPVTGATLAAGKTVHGTKDAVKRNG